MFMIPYESSSGLVINASLQIEPKVWLKNYGENVHDISGTNTHSSSSSVANRLTRKPLSVFPGFWTSNPPINLASKFSSSLASGFGAALTFWNTMSLVIGGYKKIKEPYAAIYFKSYLGMLSRVFWWPWHVSFHRTTNTVPGGEHEQ